MCALHYAQVLHTILHRTDLIIFPLTLQTIIIAQMLSTAGEGEPTNCNVVDDHNNADLKIIWCYNSHASALSKLQLFITTVTFSRHHVYNL